jgi:small subunit ribosomal protein S3
MGQKVHPYGFRVGIIRGWLSNWFAEDRVYTEQLLEDIRLRKFIESRQRNAGISRINIDRTANNISITMHTSKPGVVIGRGGRGVDGLRVELEKMAGQKVQVNVEEIKRPELDAQLVAENIAQQIERRISFRRAVGQSMGRTMRMGAGGMRVRCGGRLGGREIAYSEIQSEGCVPLHTLRADIDYGLAEARTTAGRIGVKVWIYKGDILPAPKRPPAGAVAAMEAAAAAEAAASEAEAVAPPAAVVAPPAAVVAPPAAVVAPPAAVVAPPAEAVAPPAEATAPEVEATVPQAEAAGPPAEAPPTQPEPAVAPPQTDTEALTEPESPAPPAEDAAEGTPEDADATQGEVQEAASGADEGQG